MGEELNPGDRQVLRRLEIEYRSLMRDRWELLMRPFFEFRPRLKRRFWEVYDKQQEIEMLAKRIRSRNKKGE